MFRLLLCLLALLFSACVYALPIIQVTPQGLQNKEPSEVTSLFYSLAIANDLLAKNNNYQSDFAAQFFSPELFTQFKKALAENRRTADSGCLDFNAFTGAQSVFQGFWLGKPVLNEQKITVPVYLQATQEKPNQPYLQVTLANTALGWKIIEIHYLHLNTTLTAALANCEPSAPIITTE